MKHVKFITRIFKIKEKCKYVNVEVKASFWFLICSFFQRGISVITTPIFTRLMTTQEYGQYSVFQSWMDIMTIFVSLKLYAGVFLQGIVKQTDKNRFAAAMQGLSFTLFIIWGIIVCSFHSFFTKLTSLTAVQLVAMLSLIWTTGVFSYWSVEQRTINNYKPLIVITLLTSFLKPMLGIVLVIESDDKVTARILGLAFVELLFYVSLFIKDMKKGKCFCDKAIWKYALSFNLPLLPHYLSMAVLNSSDRIMIKYYAGESKAGIYSLAYSIALIMTLFNSALLQTVEPWLYKKINANEQRDIPKVGYVTLILIAFVNIILIAFAPEAVKIFAPAEYMEAIWIIPSVAMSVYFMFAYSLFAAFEFYFEKTRYITVATLIGAIANIVLNMIFIPVFGYYAAGYTTLVCYMVFAIMHYWFMTKICRQKFSKERLFDIKILLKITISFMGIGMLFLISYSQVFIRYGLIIILLIVIGIKRNELKNILLRLINIKGINNE